MLRGLFVDHDNVTVGSSIHYIVAAVVIEDSSVLMIRESKSSCYGKWYLPAGKMQQDESIEVSCITISISPSHQ